jgi:hypothetical protein
MRTTRMRPFVEDDWDYSKMIALDSPHKMEWTHQKPLSATEFFSSTFLSHNAKCLCSGIRWNESKIFFTVNFIKPLVEKCHYDDYLRPV